MTVIVTEAGGIIAVHLPDDGGELYLELDEARDLLGQLRNILEVPDGR